MCELQISTGGRGVDFVFTGLFEESILGVGASALLAMRCAGVPGTLREEAQQELPRLKVCRSCSKAALCCAFSNGLKSASDALRSYLNEQRSEYRSAEKDG